MRYFQNPGLITVVPQFIDTLGIDGAFYVEDRNQDKVTDTTAFGRVLVTGEEVAVVTFVEAMFLQICKGDVFIDEVFVGLGCSFGCRDSIFPTLNRWDDVSTTFDIDAMEDIIIIGADERGHVADKSGFE